MEDLSRGLYVPKMQISEGFPVLPGSVMDGFSDKETTDEASRLMGLTQAEESHEEVTDGE